MCLSLIRVRFYPETNYFFSIQFILNELSSSHFLTSEIFVKISFLESLTTYHPAKCKNIPTVSEFDKTFIDHWISLDKSNDIVRFIIRDLENLLGFPKLLWQFIIIIIIIFPFLKISNFPGFYNQHVIQIFAITHKKKKKNSTHTVRKSVPDCQKTFPKIQLGLSENSPKNLVRTS